MKSTLEQRRENLISVAQNYLSDDMEITFEKPLLRKIIGTSLDYEIEDYDYDPSDNGFDTNIREHLHSLLSQYYIGESWPTYGDTRSGRVNMEDFTRKLYEAIDNHVFVE